jgi:hypothetical protein
MKHNTTPRLTQNLADHGTLQVQTCESVWHLTYEGELVTLCRTRPQHSHRIYPTVTWQQQGSARRAAGLMNQRFRTLAFGYVRMVPVTVSQGDPGAGF